MRTLKKTGRQTNTHALRAQYLLKGLLATARRLRGHSRLWIPPEYTRIRKIWNLKHLEGEEEEETRSKRTRRS
jgi:hypothetical protein